MSIIQKQTTQNEIVITERVVSTEYRIVLIEEHIIDRRVEVAVELGPFVEESRPIAIREFVAKGGRRRFTVWQGVDYDAIRDTWTNNDLIAKVAELMQ